MTKTKIKKLLAGLESIEGVKTFKQLDSEILNLVQNVKAKRSGQTANKLNEIVNLIQRNRSLNNKQMTQLLQKVEFVRLDLIDNKRKTLSTSKSIEGVKSDNEVMRAELTESIATLEQSLGTLKTSLQSLEIPSLEALEDKVKELTDDLEQISFRLNYLHAGGSANRQIKVNGVDVLKQYTDIDLIGSITTAVDNVNKNVEITFAGGIGNPITITGTINDSNMAFTAPEEPTLLVINGGVYQQTGGAITWSYSLGNITISSPVGDGGSIFGL
jgi:hypothetical protein